MSEVIVKINSKSKSILLEASELKLDNQSFDYEFEKLYDGRYLLKVGKKFYNISAERLNRENFVLVVNGIMFETEARTSLEEKARKVIELSNQNSGEHIVKAPMPGMILKIQKKPGDSIKSSESIMILEAMKMENELKSPSEGKIKEIFVKVGDKVEKNTKLFSTEL